MTRSNGPTPVSHLTDIELRDRVVVASARERAATSHLVALLAEFDRRQLYLAEGCSSMFRFCTETLHLSEAAAYKRIQAARAARKWPAIIERLRDGTITLGALGTLAPYLTDANCKNLLEEARHRGKRDVELIVARLRPQPDVPSAIRKLPSRELPTGPSPTVAPMPALLADSSVTAAPCGQTPHAAAGGAAPPTQRAIIAPLTPERYKLQVTVDRDAHDLLRQAQDLMRHAVPSGDPAVIVTRALRLLVDDLLRKKAAAVAAPRRPRGVDDTSRTIPAHVRRAVWARDGGRCAFEGSRGRCGARGVVEYHHVIPYAMGGMATVENIELRCRAHNAHETRLAGLERPEEEVTGVGLSLGRAAW